MFLPIYVYVKHVTPGVGPFWPQGYNLNKLVRGPQGDATYQISKLASRPYGFRQEDFFYVSPYIT